MNISLKELVISFIAGMASFTLWFILHNESKLTYPFLLYHFALPIQIIATIFFYSGLYLHKVLSK